MVSCIIHLSFYLPKKTVGLLINYRLGCNKSHMFLHVHNHQTWTQIVTLSTAPHKVKNQQIKWYQTLCIHYYKITNMLGSVNRM